MELCARNFSCSSAPCIETFMQVHPCTHPEGKPAPETEEEMMLEVFKYTERVVNMVRPRKVLMMAIGMSFTFPPKSLLTSFADGVAPRAKMNQQRSRRFRAAQEAKEKEEARQDAIKEWEGELPEDFLLIRTDALRSSGDESNGRRP